MTTSRAMEEAQWRLANRLALYRLPGFPKALFEFIGKDHAAHFNLSELHLAVTWLDAWSERGQPGRPDIR